MNIKQLEIMKNKKGFISALDQSGGSTPKALRNYGINEDQYSNDTQMFDLVHKMRSRIIKSKAYNENHIIGAILFKKTMESKIDGLYSGDYLWEKKGIVPFLKVDEGLADLNNGVQLMKEMKELDELLSLANKRNIFGTKMRSVIKEYNEKGIEDIINQQFEYGIKICKAGLVPILEPEVDINSKDKEKIEEFMKKEIVKHLENLSKDDDTKDMKLMFKFTIPTKENLYDDLLNYDSVVRIVALSGGYSREKANELLAKNHNMIASFSRALLEGLNANQSDEEFDKVLGKSIEDIYEASVK